MEFHVRTAAPRWFLQDLSFPVYHENRPVDVGIVQKDSLEMNVGKTLEACRIFHQQIPKLIDDEISFIKRKKIRLILGDVPPLCFEVAWRASLPSVAIGNFTWDWIYRAYLRDFSSFLPFIEEMESFYRKASLALALPFSCDMGIFPNQQPIPLISRISSLDKVEARKRFSLPVAARVVLISFGGFGLDRLPWGRLKRLDDFIFVTTGGASKTDRNLLFLPEAQAHYEDLVRAADVVISKPGYGIVADVIAHRVPLLYTSRGDFSEYPFLLEALRCWATCEFIPQEELLAGKVGPYLARAMEKEPNWPVVSLNGAQIAAEKILDLLRRD